MANQLKMAMVNAITTLKQRGWSMRHIARDLGIDRGTVKRYVELEDAKPASKAPTGSEEISKPATNAPLGFETGTDPPGNRPPGTVNRRKYPWGANMCITKTREVFNVETERVMLHR